MSKTWDLPFYPASAADDVRAALQAAGIEARVDVVSRERDFPYYSTPPPPVGRVRFTGDPERVKAVVIEALRQGAFT